MNADRETIIVLGNARSGTSLTAGILSRLGVSMNQVEESNPGNPKGAYEDPFFLLLTRAIKNSIDAGRTRDELQFMYDAAIKKAVSDRHAPAWGWKSCLTHYMLDLFLPHVVNPHLVFVFRNPYTCARSWQIHMRDWCGLAVSMPEAMKEVANGIQVLCNCAAEFCFMPSAFVTYEEIKASANSEAERLASFLGVEINDSARASIAEFVMPDYTTIPEAA